MARKKKVLEIHGYYFDGKYLFTLYKDKYGKIVTKKEKL
tara:strand:- start:451 stop:567 length:117 start_codon:yes stop_codon:yes gene_type:complete